jgi:hypothetical protein
MSDEQISLRPNVLQNVEVDTNVIGVVKRKDIALREWGEVYSRNIAYARRLNTLSCSL